MSISAEPARIEPEHVEASARPTKGFERRQGIRHPAIYRPCCVIAPERVSMGLIRNFSAGGAKIEADLELAVGDRIRYFWEAETSICARIVWRDGREYGLEHLDQVPNDDDTFPVRSVRVPCEAEAVCWIGGEVHTSLVENISIGGVRLRGLPPFPPGTMMTIRICDLELASAAIRWTEDAHAGVRFQQRLTRHDLARLLLDERFGLSTIEFGADQAE